MPIHFLKFEELRNEPKKVLSDVWKFMLNVDDISGTYIEKRIDDVLALGHGATRVYNVKSTDGKFSKIDLFTPALQEHVKTELATYCEFFDYFKTGENGTAANEYQFFDRPANLKKQTDLNYKKVSDESIKWNASMTDEERAAHELLLDYDMGFPIEGMEEMVNDPIIKNP